MRLPPTSHINDLWTGGGPFIGDDGAPHGRVTVEIGWHLNRTGTHVGTYVNGPIRWFQREDNSQDETEIPNILTIGIDRSIDSDAGQCNIEIANVQMLADGAIMIGDSEFGERGFFSFGRGVSSNAQSRWGQNQNSWKNILVPNALLRTYQGYGGRDKTLVQALADGNIIQTGTWLVDTVQIGTDGKLKLGCRDPAKLLIDQSIYPPLVPTNTPISYPLRYFRWINELKNHTVIPYGSVVYKTGYSGTNPDTAGGNVFSSSQMEAPTIAGHSPTDACDPFDQDSYWLSTGHAANDYNRDMEWIQFGLPGDPMNGFDIFPYGGGYLCYVSVRVGGTWQGTATIPYTGSRYGPSTGHYAAAIPYVMKFVTPWEHPALKFLPATYNANLIRLTFAKLVRTTIGPQYYRAGVRDFNTGAYTGTVSGNGKIICGIERSDAADDGGYALVGSDGGVFSFGDWRFQGSRGGRHNNAVMIGMASHHEKRGYWLAGADGGVFTFGKNMRFWGALPGHFVPNQPIIAIERAAAVDGGDGYYLLGGDGGVYAFGDAVFHGTWNGGNPTGTDKVAMAVRPQGGYYMLSATGELQAFGGANFHNGSGGIVAGSGEKDVRYLHIPFVNSPTGVVCSPDGQGYAIIGRDGGVFTFGSFPYLGSLPGSGIVPNDKVSDIEVVPGTGQGDVDGYWLCAEDGGVFTYGPIAFHGSLPQTWYFEDRRDGNYKDYSDIIRDLVLWCGFYFYDSDLATNEDPSVFGNIETTGAFAPDALTEDFFDKQPVIDIIHAIKEIVGYVCYVDDIGAFRFESPNIWEAGNHFEDGTRTSIIPEIDEALQITNYSVSYTDKDARTPIIVSTSDPVEHFKGTVTAVVNSSFVASLLKSIVRPALWVNGVFQSTQESQIMAELIDLHLSMAARQGSVTCQANPVIQVDDQVRIWERQSAETYIHYVRGMSTSMDLDAGTYDMTVNTHWMGDGTFWFIQYN